MIEVAKAENFTILNGLNILKIYDLYTHLIDPPIDPLLVNRGIVKIDIFGLVT